MRNGITHNKCNQSIKRTKNNLTNTILRTITLLVCTSLILVGSPTICFAEEILFSKFAYESMTSRTKVPNLGHLKIMTEIVCSVSGYDIEFILEEESKTNAIQVKEITGYIFNEHKMIDTIFIEEAPKLEAGSQVTLMPVFLNASANNWIGLAVETNDGQVFKYIRQLPENANATNTGIAYSAVNDDEDYGEVNDTGAAFLEQSGNNEQADDVEQYDTETGDMVSYDAETENAEPDDNITQDKIESIDAASPEE